MGWKSLPVASDKLSNLLWKLWNWGQKSFITLAPGPNNIEFSDEEKEFYSIELPVKNNDAHFINLPFHQPI